MLSEATIISRREFDLSFAQVPNAGSSGTQHLLAIRVGGDAYAVRVNEIDGLFVNREVVSVPSPMSELLGIACFRSQFAPVYDLSVLLGYARQPSQRWLVLAKGKCPLALAFDDFVAQLTPTSDQIMSIEDGALSSNESGVRAPSSYIRHAIRIDGVMHSLIHLPSVIEEIQRRIDLARHAKES